VTDDDDEVVEFDTTQFSQGFEPLVTYQIPVPYDGIYLLNTVLDWKNDAGIVRTWFTVNSTKVEGESRGDMSVADSMVVRLSLTAIRQLTAGDKVGVTVHTDSHDNQPRDINGGVENCSLTVIFLMGI